MAQSAESDLKPIWYDNVWALEKRRFSKTQQVHRQALIRPYSAREGRSPYPRTTSDYAADKFALLTKVVSAPPARGVEYLKSSITYRAAINYASQLSVELTRFKGYQEEHIAIGALQDLIEARRAAACERELQDLSVFLNDDLRDGVFVAFRAGSSADTNPKQLFAARLRGLTVDEVSYGGYMGFTRLQTGLVIEAKDGTLGTLPPDAQQPQLYRQVGGEV